MSEAVAVPHAPLPWSRDGRPLEDEDALQVQTSRSTPLQPVRWH
jgi:hypothetical protein